MQEAGVDEPDVVKTDGRRVFTISDGTLRAIDVSGPAPRLIGARKLDGHGSHQLFLRGDRVLVITTSFGGPQLGAPAGIGSEFPRPAKVVLTEVDVSGPEAMIVNTRTPGCAARRTCTRSPTTCCSASARTRPSRVARWERSCRCSTSRIPPSPFVARRCR